MVGPGGGCRSPLQRSNQPAFPPTHPNATLDTRIEFTTRRWRCPNDTLKYHRRERGFTLAVSLRQIKTVIEYPFSITHSALPNGQKRAFGMHSRRVRLSIGLEDWHDIIRDLELALEKV